VPSPDVVFPLPIDPTGTIDFTAPWLDAPPGLSFYFQYWIPDPTGPAGFAASNAITATTVP